MFSEDWEDPRLDPDGVLADYHRWLYRVAIDMANNPSDVEDLVQEGRIAMWRAIQTFDADRVALPYWITTAARMRMKDIARGRPATGHQPVNVKDVEPALSLDAFDPEADRSVEEIFGLIETLDTVEIAYHKGLVAKALETLTPQQRQYVFLRFFAGLDPTSRSPEMTSLRGQYAVMSKRWLWNGSARQQGARDRLRAALRELEGSR